MLTAATIQNFTGLAIQGNSFSQVPDGSLERAENLTISSDGILRKRRGFSLLTATAGLTSPKAMADHGGALLVAQNGLLSQVNTSTGALTHLSGALVAPTSGKPRFAALSGNLYATSANGVRKIESLAAPLLPAGIPPGLDVSVSLKSTNSGVFAPNAQVGYRVLFGRKDVSGNKVVGAPSELTALANNYINSAATYSGAPGLTLTIISTAHGFANGDTVVLAGATDANLNGEWTVAASAANTFQVTVVSSVATSGTVKVGKYSTPSLQATIPAGLSTEHFIQVYRTSQTADLSIDVSDDCQLVYEANLTSAQVTAGAFTFDDDVEELFRDAELYTNPNQSGIASSNFEPPLCADIAVFKSCVFYAGTETKHDLSVSLVSVQVADFTAGTYLTVVSGATTHRYVATTIAPTSSPGTPNTSSSWNYGGTDASGYVFFQLTNSSSVTVASSISATAKSLCKAINRHAAGLLYAYYVSGPDDIPGQIRLVRRMAGSVFTVTTQNATTGDAFSPNLYNAGVGRASTNSVLPHAASFSKPQEGEAVPLAYQLLVGAKSARILRIVPLRESLLVLKQDGLWRISGEGPSSFTVTLIDSTIVCVAPDSVVSLANQVFFLSTQGVVAATETSAAVLSRPIEAVLSPILGSPALLAETSAVAYESERLYVLSTIQPASSQADVVYVYNTVTRAWTTWDSTFKDALVFSGDDRLYLLTTESDLRKERKSQNLLDYCDLSYAITCTATDPDALQAQFSGSVQIRVNDCVINAGGEIINRVVAVDSGTTPPTISFQAPLSFEVADACVLYTPIRSVAKTTPLTLGDATVWKQYSDVRVAFRNRATSALGFTFENDSRSSNDVLWEAESTGTGWGFNWGSFWGGPSIATIYVTQGTQEARVLVPLETSRGMYLQTTLVHERAAESFEVQAISVTARPHGHRLGR